MWKIVQDHLTGATGAAYADALDWQAAELVYKSILLKNTDGTDSLYYKLSAYFHPDGNANVLVPETSLAAGETAQFNYDRQYHRLVLQVKNNSGSATYEVDYQGKGA